MAKGKGNKSMKGGAVKGFGGKGGGWPMTKGAANAPKMPPAMKGKMPRQKQPVS